MQESIKNQIKELIDKYVISIDEADVDLASEIWLDSHDTSFIHPKGHEHGFEEIKQNFYSSLMGERFSERKLTPYDISIYMYGDTAIAEFYWDFSAKFSSDCSLIKTRGRETQVFCKNPQAQWKLVHVHYSSMPVIGEREGF